MDIQSQLVVLRELYQIDIELVQVMRELDRLRSKGRLLEQEGQEHEHKLQELIREQSEVGQRQRQYESQLQIERGNLRKWEGRAQDLRGEREYAALMSEINSQRRLISDLENQVLQCMQEKEDLNERVGQIKGAAQEVGDKARSEAEAVGSEVGQLQQQCDRLESTRKELQVKLPQRLLARYHRIAKQRSGQGVALLKQEICQACMCTVPPELFLRVFKGEVVEQCPHCQRLLVVQPPDAGADGEENQDAQD
ncbi:MAG: C4-type zinc ribbon domain-containing protein [Myxococcota bacterium]